MGCDDKGLERKVGFSKPEEFGKSRCFGIRGSCALENQNQRFRVLIYVVISKS
jgi:hypothetical protein